MTSDAANETASGKPPGPTTSKEKPGVEAAAAAAKETPSPPSEMLTPMGQAIQFAEKKIRNLEKRIAKLDGYKETARRGKPLNDDQKAAVAKYDEVMQTAEFARDMVVQLKNLAADEEKAGKKKAKKDAADKAKADVRKISNVLQAQHFLDRLCKALKDAAAKEDLAEGKNGASKLTKEQIDAVFEFSRAVGDKATSDFDKSGELWNCLVESRKRKVGKSSSTFKEAMEALELTIACGYLDNLKGEEEKEERSSPESKEGGKAKKDRRKDKEQGKNKQQQQNGDVKPEPKQNNKESRRVKTPTQDKPKMPEQAKSPEKSQAKTNQMETSSRSQSRTTRRAG